MTKNEDLIKRIKSGEQNLTDELYNNVKKLIVQTANDFYKKNKYLINKLQSVDYDDIIQNANISFIKSIKSYNTKGLTLYSTYLVQSIQLNLYTEFYPNKKIANKYQKELCSQTYENNHEIANDKTQTKIDNQILIEQLMKVLDEKEKNLITDKFFIGLKPAELVNKYGLTITAIRNKINKALIKMRKEAEKK